MRLILETFANIAKNPGGKKIAVLADMKELGKDSVILHSQLIDSLTSGNIDQLVFYGDHIKELARLASQVYPAEQVHYFLKTEQEDQFEAMAQYVQNILNPFDQILLKGSHSMSLEKLVDRLVTDKNCDSYQP